MNRNRIMRDIVGTPSWVSCYVYEQTTFLSSNRSIRQTGTFILDIKQKGNHRTSLKLYLKFGTVNVLKQLSLYNHHVTCHLSPTLHKTSSNCYRPRPFFGKSVVATTNGSSRAECTFSLSGLESFSFGDRLLKSPYRICWWASKAYRPHIDSTYLLVEKGGHVDVSSSWDWSSPQGREAYHPKAELKIADNRKQSVVRTLDSWVQQKPQLRADR